MKHNTATHVSDNPKDYLSLPQNNEGKSQNSTPAIINNPSPNNESNKKSSA